MTKQKNRRIIELKKEREREKNKIEHDFEENLVLIKILFEL